MAKATCISGMTSSKKVAEEYYATLTYGDQDFSNKIFVDHMGATHLFPFGGTLASAGDIWATMVSAITDDNQDPAATQAEYAPRRSRGIRLLLLQHRSERGLTEPIANAKGSANCPLRLPIKRKLGESL